MKASPAKLDLLASFVLRPSQWDGTAAKWASKIPTDSPGDLSAVLADEVEKGRAQVCRVERHGIQVGFLVFSATERHELLVHAAFGRDGSDLLPDAFGIFDGLARMCECDVVRFHTMRPGLIRRAQADGFRVSEVIMRRDVRRG